jgi:hypothetical protein
LAEIATGHRRRRFYSRCRTPEPRALRRALTAALQGLESHCPGKRRHAADRFAPAACPARFNAFPSIPVNPPLRLQWQ